MAIFALFWLDQVLDRAAAERLLEEGLGHADTVLDMSYADGSPAVQIAAGKALAA